MKNHILIVDDEQNVREICKEFLEEEDYKVTLAVDGQDALDKMDYEDFDLFLIDMAMPRIGGFELMNKIKSKQPLAVIVILTGFSSIEGAIKAVHAGAFQYLSKPINAEELLESVRKGIQYSQDLYGPLSKVFEPGSETVQKGEPVILSGFSPDDKMDFMALSSIYKYDANENIPMDGKTNNSIFLVESGEVSVWLSGSSIDFLRKWDTWNEESFILNSAVDCKLRAETAVKIRLFDRKKLLDFFGYKGEKLLKKFMINLANCMFIKWRKSAQRIVMLKLVTSDR